MPADFDACINSPGSVKFTKSLPGDKFVHGCRRRGSDKAVWGEIKHKKPSTAGFLKK